MAVAWYRSRNKAVRMVQRDAVAVKGEWVGGRGGEYKGSTLVKIVRLQAWPLPIA